MDCNGDTIVWDLRAGELVELADARGTTLRVTHGRLWLTQEHDSRDIVLGAGESFTLDGAGLALAEAQRRTTVCLHAPRVAATGLRQSTAALAQRIGAWLDALADADVRRQRLPYV
jgi:hypothetical protein